MEVEGEAEAAKLEQRIQEVVGDTARIRRPERKTLVLLLDVPEWAEVDDVVGGLAQAGVVVAAPGADGNQVFVRKNSGGRGERVARVDLSLRGAITLAEKKAVIT